MSDFNIPIFGSLFESFAAEFKDKVKPVPGSVLRCDLCGGATLFGGRLCHTGIYLGKDKVAEIANVGGKAIVQIVDPYDFLNGQGTNFLRTGINIYVATDGEGRALGSGDIARHARAIAAHLRKRGEYDLAENNCHTFTVWCVTGEIPDEMQLTDLDVGEALKSAFGCDRVTWEPTGFGSGDFSFDDVDYS